VIWQIIPWEWLAGIGAVVIAFAATWLGGRKSAKTDAKLEKAKAASETRERMDNAPIADDADSARDWLRSHSERLRDDRKP
jgi:dienelactone hydrolase